MTNEERDQKIRETHDAVTRMQEAWEAYRKLVDELARTLKGHNNTPGLVAEVGKLKLVVNRIMGPVLIILLAAGVGWAFSKF